MTRNPWSISNDGTLKSTERSFTTLKLKHQSCSKGGEKGFTLPISDIEPLCPYCGEKLTEQPSNPERRF